MCSSARLWDVQGAHLQRWCDTAPAARPAPSMNALQSRRKMCSSARLCGPAAAVRRSAVPATATAADAAIKTSSTDVAACLLIASVLPPIWTFSSDAVAAQAVPARIFRAGQHGWTFSLVLADAVAALPARIFRAGQHGWTFSLVLADAVAALPARIFRAGQHGCATASGTEVQQTKPSNVLAALVRRILREPPHARASISAR
eukprot:NODE_12791_length_1204_cov_2.660167.p2 GENE.NODE_12791_length_1204_cov_2.660167~~NODE_12791_length_1204_cov_2.660167.p2  ORF type:complete len:203 (+),score=30.15 NODE_12791_length_1204_cov_2.660167:409-1017(+)